MPQSMLPKFYMAVLWSILTFVSLYLRPLFPIDETRYAAVAWEMWSRHDFLVPHLNGETYSHKPPLLFWLMHLSWLLFGINDWSLRIIAPLFSLASLYLIQVVARTLWPERQQIAGLSPLVLLGSFFWMVFGTLTMFDIMLSFFALLGIYAILLLIKQGLSYKRWLLLGVAIGGGVLTKGPVILLHVLPLGLLAPWFLSTQDLPVNKKSWYVGLLTAVVIGAAIALSWAIPAGMAGGEAYRKAIFLGQTSGRIVDSFAHKLPFWWYLQLLPLLLMPWLLVKPIWGSVKGLNNHDFGLRFCMTWAVPVFIAFSLVSGKRIHYLLPLMPALALVISWLIDQHGEVNWRRPQLLIAILMGFVGLTFGLLPWLTDIFRLPQDLFGLSPIWGLLLIINALILGFMTANHAQNFVSTVCMSAIAAALILCAGFFHTQGYRYDTAPPAQKIAELMKENRAIAYFGGKYHGQFNFTGRLTQPIALVQNQSELLTFINQHPTGYVLVEQKEPSNLPQAVVSYSFPFKSRQVIFIACQALMTNPESIPLLKGS